MEEGLTKRSRMSRRVFLRRMGTGVVSVSVAGVTRISWSQAAAAEIKRGSSAIGITYYASPAGGGNGRSPGSPFKIAGFWAVAKPGDTLVLLDGRYAADDSKITPPEKLSGEPARPITIRALHDGKVELDGEGVRRTVNLFFNDYFILEGFNAHGAYGRRDHASTVQLSRSNHCIVRRVCAWDAQDGNTEVFGTHGHGDHNLFEDCAGWGIARKVYQNSQGGDYTTYRRCLAIWQGCHAVGPKMGFSMFYNSRGIVAENCIALWNGTRMKETHQAMANDGKPFADWSTGPKGPHTYTNYGVDQPYGCFSADANRKIGPTKGPYLYGCMAFALKSHRIVRIPGLFYMPCKQEDGFLENCAALVEEGAASLRPFYLSKIKARGLTAVGDAEPSLGGAQVENLLRATGAEGRAAWAAMLRKEPPDRGAHLYYRYENGKLTGQPLWPWPMNQRIKELIGLDVTTTLMRLGVS